MNIMKVCSSSSSSSSSSSTEQYFYAEVMEHGSNQPHLMKDTAWLSWERSAQLEQIGEANSPAR
jgi:hypothetical protein